MMSVNNFRFGDYILLTHKSLLFTLTFNWNRHRRKI